MYSYLKKVYSDESYLNDVDYLVKRWRRSYNNGLSSGAYKEMVKQCKIMDVEYYDVIDRIHELNLYDR